MGVGATLGLGTGKDMFLKFNFTFSQWILEISRLMFEMVYSTYSFIHSFIRTCHLPPICQPLGTQWVAGTLPLRHDSEESCSNWPTLWLLYMHKLPYRNLKTSATTHVSHQYFQVFWDVSGKERFIPTVIRKSRFIWHCFQ